MTQQTHNNYGLVLINDCVSLQVADELVKELTESEKKSAQMVVYSHSQLYVTFYLQPLLSLLTKRTSDDVCMMPSMF